MGEDEATRKTYRYLRIGMIGAMALLAVSVLLEHAKAPAGCWQTSLSAYYYTPVRAVFVGALLAIGLSLIVLKGSPDAEDAALNVAGMLAPVVALVPTADIGTCWRYEPVPAPKTSTGDLAPWVLDNIDNNVRALLFTGYGGLALAAAIALGAVVVGRKRDQDTSIADAWHEDNRATTAWLLGAFAALVVATLLYHHWDGFQHHAHSYSAAGMFLALAVAVLVNARACRRSGRRTYAALYLVIGVGMLASGPILLIGSWDHHVLAVELIEIALFIVFWAVQTRELWHTTVRPRSAGGSP